MYKINRRYWGFENGFRRLKQQEILKELNQGPQLESYCRPSSVDSGLALIWAFEKVARCQQAQTTAKNLFFTFPTGFIFAPDGSKRIFSGVLLFLL